MQTDHIGSGLTSGAGKQPAVDADEDTPKTKYGVIDDGLIIIQRLDAGWGTVISVYRSRYIGENAPHPHDE